MNYDQFHDLSFGIKTKLKIFNQVRKRWKEREENVVCKKINAEKLRRCLNFKRAAS